MTTLMTVLLVVLALGVTAFVAAGYIGYRLYKKQKSKMIAFNKRHGLGLEDLFD